MLLANDAALGRRATNLGVRWLHAADLVVLCAAGPGGWTPEAVVALDALHTAGRISEKLWIDDLGEI
jgi:hypothetical protein